MTENDGKALPQNLIYFDNAATTKPLEEALKAVADAMRGEFGNPSSAHGLGMRAAHTLNGARTAVARALQAPPNCIYFTASGSESNNAAIFGACPLHSRNPGHIVTTRTEHASILNSVLELENRGWQVSYVGVDGFGRVDLDALEGSVRQDTALIALSHVNNETGVAQPLETIGRIKRRKNPKAVLFVDCVQSFCKLELLPARALIDVASFSAHKIHGPKGIAALYARDGVKLRPAVFGGGQEGGFRSGTENTPGILGFSVAAGILSRGMAGSAAGVELLKARMLEGLAASGLEYRCNSLQAGAAATRPEYRRGSFQAGAAATRPEYRRGSFQAGMSQPDPPIIPNSSAPPSSDSPSDSQSLPPSGSPSPQQSDSPAGLNAAAISPACSPYILNVSFPGLKSEVLLRRLSMEGVYVSSGSACSSRHSSRRGSHVLNAMGLRRDIIDGAIRFSFSPFNTADEVGEVLEKLKSIVPELKAGRRAAGQRPCDAAPAAPVP